MIKQAALGAFFRKPTSASLNLKFFLKSTRPSLPLKKGLSKTHQSSLTLKGGSTAFPKPIFSWRRLAALGIVQASLTLLSFAQPFPSGYRGCTNRPFNSLYDPFGSPCRGQKRCSNRFAIRLADHQRSTPAAELRFFVRDEPQGHDAGCLMLIARNLQELLFMGTQGHNAG